MVRPALLTGTRAAGTLQLSERGINEVLAELMQHASNKAACTLQPNNVLMLRYGLVHARVELPREAAPADAPYLTLRLASVVVAWALKAVVHQPFISIRGRDVTIDLRALPLPEPWRDLWKYVKRLSFETVPGALRLGFRLEMQ